MEGMELHIGTGHLDSARGRSNRGRRLSSRGRGYLNRGPSGSSRGRRGWSRGQGAVNRGRRGLSRGRGAVNNVQTSSATFPTFSPESWSYITDNLSQEDFRSVINTSPEWRSVLHSKVATSLFPQVLERLSEYLPLDTFLNCRFLNEKAKAKVDSILQKDQSPLAPAKSYPALHENDDSKISNNKKIEALDDGAYKFDSFEKIQSFMDHYKLQEGVGTNRFLTRSAMVPIGNHPASFFTGLPAGDRIIQWESTVARLLNGFGTHLFNLNIGLYDFAAEHHGQSLINLLGLVPNLKVLKFCGEGESWTPEQLRGWKSLGFPVLPSLRVIDMASCSTDLDEEDRRSSFLEPFILKYGNRFKRIIVAAVDSTGEEDNVNDVNIFKQNLLMAENCDHFILGETFGFYGTDVVAINRMGSKLKELQLMYINHVETFRQSVNHSAPNLRRLNVFCYLPGPIGRLSGHMEKQPKLSKLSTWIDNIEVDWFIGFLKEKYEHLRLIQLYMMEKVSKEEATRAAYRAFDLPQVRKVVVWSDDATFEFSTRHKYVLTKEIAKESKRYVKLQRL